MSDETKYIGEIAFVLVIIVVFLTLGWLGGQSATRSDAVRNNAAHYEADATGASEFKWGPKP